MRGGSEQRALCLIATARQSQSMYFAYTHILCACMYAYILMYCAYTHILYVCIHIYIYERRTKVPSLETCLASVKSPGNHAFSL